MKQIIGKCTEMTLSRERHAAPLYHQLKDVLKARIEAGEFSEDQLVPSEAKLISEYGVSRVTVVRALRELEYEGTVSRVHGKGTFVTGASPPFSNREIAGIAMQTRGHLYEQFAGEIIKRLQGIGYYCMVMDCDELEAAPEKFAGLIARQPDILIVHGYDNFPVGTLADYNGKIIFVHIYEHEKKMRGCYVLSDYYKGGRLAAQHLSDRGCGKIIFKLDYWTRMPRSRNDMMRGGIDLLQEKGFSAENFVVLKQGFNREICSLLEGVETPVGIICDSDHAALEVYKFAREQGLVIPRDILVMGYYNTPWCQAFDPALTSVSIREADIAKLVSEQIDKKPSTQNILVEPEIISRESTGIGAVVNAGICHETFCK